MEKLLLKRRMSTLAYSRDNFIDCTYSYYKMQRPVLFNSNKLVYVDKIVINGQLLDDVDYVCPELSLNANDIFSVQIYLTNDEPLLELADFFSGCNSLVSVDFSHVKTLSQNDDSLNNIFNGCIMLQQVTWGQSINWELYTDFTQAFYRCTNIKEITLPGHALKYFDRAFFRCDYLEKVSGYINHFESALLMFANIRKSTKLDIDIKSDKKDYITDNESGDNNPRSAEKMFYNCVNLELINFINLDTNYLFTSYACMFEDCKALKRIDMSVFKFDRNYLFNYANRMFANCECLLSIDNFYFNPLRYPFLSETSETDYSAMFINCAALNNLNLHSLESLLGSSMDDMFKGCKELTNLNISNLDTSSITSFKSTFEGCEKLEAIDLSNFNTSKATNFNGMFRDCSSLQSLDLSTFTWGSLEYNAEDTSEDWSKCSGVLNMMRGCTSLKSVTIRNPFPVSYTQGITHINNLHHSKRRTAFYKFLDSDTKITTEGTLYWPYLTLVQINPDYTTTNVIYPANSDSKDNFNLSKIPYGICSSDLLYNETTDTVTIDNPNTYDEDATQNYDTLPDNWNIVLLGAPKRNGFAALYSLDILTNDLINGTHSWIKEIKVFPSYYQFKANDISNNLKLDSSGLRLITDPGRDIYVEFVLNESAASGIDFTSFFEDKPIIAVDFSFFTYPVTKIEKMFRGCSLLQHIGSFNTYNPDGLNNSYINFNITNVVSAEKLFLECSALKGVLLINQTVKINNLTNAFDNCENLNYISLNSSECKNWQAAFYGCSKLLEVTLTSWELSTTSTGGFDNIFNGCAKLKFKNNIILNGGSSSNCLSCNNTFRGCELLNLDSIKLTIGAYINSMQGTFQDCIGLNNASGLYITHKDTITHLNSIFKNTGFEIINDKTCPAFTDNNAVFPNVTDIREAFADCEKLTTFEVKNYHKLSGVKSKEFETITDKDGKKYLINPSEYKFVLNEKCVQDWFASSVKVSKLFYNSPLEKILILRDLNIDTDYYTDMFTTKDTSFRFIYDGFNVREKSNYQYILDEIVSANPDNIYIGYNVISVPIKANDKISSYGVYDCPGLRSSHVKFHNAYAYKKANEPEFKTFTISEGDLSGGLKCNEVTIDENSIIDICWRITGNNKVSRIYTEYTYTSKIQNITLSTGEQEIECFEPKQMIGSNNDNKWLVCPTFGYYWPEYAFDTHKLSGTSVNGDCYFSLLYTEDFDKFTCRLLDLNNHNDENGSDLYSAQSKNYGIYASRNYEGFNIPNRGFHFFNRNFDKHFIEPIHFCTNLKFKDEKSSMWYINQAGSRTDIRPYKLFRSIIFGDEEIYYLGDFCLYNSGTYKANDSNSSYPPKVIIPWGCTNRFSNLFKNSRCREFHINYEKDSKNTTDTKWPIVNLDGSNKDTWSELSFNELFAQCYFAENIYFLLPVITNNQEYYDNNKKKKTDLIDCYRMFYYACRAYWNNKNKKLLLYCDSKLEKGEISNLLTRYQNNYKDQPFIQVDNQGY